MIVRKLSEAKPYEAPNHREYKSLRVFGAEMGGSQALIFGISHFLPGGGAGPDASPPEKIYHVRGGRARAGARPHGDHRRQGDRDQAGRHLLHRPEREPRDHQPQQRGVHHRSCGDDAAGEVMHYPLVPAKAGTQSPKRDAACGPGFPLSRE